MARITVIPPDHPKYPAIKHAKTLAWIKTILGYSAMGGLILLALWGFGFTYKFQLGFGMLWWFLPVVMWWFSAKVALMITKSVPADPSIPAHKRLIDIVDRVYAKSGLKFKPPVYISDNPLPNAFATGPVHRKAVVAATKGLFECGMTDAEIEAVFAHELGHVKNYDVALNTFVSVLSMIFFSIVDGGVRILMGSIRWFKKTVGMNPEKNGFITGVLEWIITAVIFQVISQFTKIVQAFVVRSRESGADASGAEMTGEPCDLATRAAEARCVRREESSEGSRCRNVSCAPSDDDHRPDLRRPGAGFEAADPVAVDQECLEVPPAHSPARARACRHARVHERRLLPSYRLSCGRPESD